MRTNRIKVFVPVGVKKPLRLLALLLAMSAVGCDDDPNEMSLRFESASKTLEVSFADDDSRIVMDCSGYLAAYRTENGERGALIGSDFDHADIDCGYMLDGELIPPIVNMGCDVWSCMPLEGMNRTLGLTEYRLEGTHTLTEAEKAAFDEALPDPFTSVDEVNVYTTSTYTGVVEVELTYYTTEECHDETLEAKTEVQRITVE